jgi:CDP-diacylglycerol--inositol 3-phosphatidyltransferase
MAYLTTIYPNWMPFFQFLMALDLSSHYMHMFSSLAGGATSHKTIEKKANPILRLYYHNRVRTLLYLLSMLVYP